MNKSWNLELIALLAVFGGSLVLVGIAAQSRSGDSDAVLAGHTMQSPLISEADASTIVKTSVPKTAPSDNAETPIYLDLGAKYGSDLDVTNSATQTRQAALPPRPVDHE